MPKLAEGQSIFTVAELEAWTEAAQKHGMMEGKEKGYQEAINYISSLVDVCKLSGKIDLFPKFLDEKITVDDAKKEILEDQRKSSYSIRSTVRATSTGGEENPLIADAKFRAKA
jgi:hypothetical protein